LAWSSLLQCPPEYVPQGQTFLDAVRRLGQVLNGRLAASARDVHGGVVLQVDRSDSVGPGFEQVSEGAEPAVRERQATFDDTLAPRAGSRISDASGHIAARQHFVASQR